jgi:hypothetical protein
MPPPRLNHKRVRWEKGRWGAYIRLSPLCAREDLRPNVDRGRYHEEEVEHQTTTVNSYGFQLEAVGRNRPVIEVAGEAGATTTSKIKARVYDHAHIVIGVMGAKTGKVSEVLVENLLGGELFNKNEGLFKKIRGAKRKLRPWWKSLLSLKSVQGFSLYCCYPDNEYHERMEMDEMTKTILSEFWHEYNHQREDKGGRWLAWVQQHLNRGDIPVRIAEDEPGPDDPSEDQRQIPSPDARSILCNLLSNGQRGRLQSTS